MKTVFSGVLVLFMAAAVQAAPAAGDMAGALLKASDQNRGGMAEGVSWNIKIESSEDGDTTVREFSVKAKDRDAHVEATSPARNKGEVFIFNDRNMWFFKPSLKKPVAISARQKLSGQAANGDIASTNYARDYTPTLGKDRSFEWRKNSCSDVEGES